MSDQVECPPSRPAMPTGLAARVAEADARIEQRPLNPGVALDESPGPLWFTAPHADQESWRKQITDAFGSRSMSIAQMFLSQLSQLCSREWQRDRWEPDDVELNAVLGIVNSIRPDNELQAALAAQMVAVHLATMKVAGQALRGMVVDKLTANTMARLAATYALQCEALDRLKGRRGRQEINVRYERHDHKHVHVEGGGAQTGDQPHAPTRLAQPSSTVVPNCGSPAGEHERSSPMHGPDESRLALLLPGGKGSQALPHAWRGTWLRRAKRGSQRRLPGRGMNERRH